MEERTARLTILVDPRKKALFEELCAREDQTPSQVVRRLIRDYLTQHGVTYVPSGTAPSSPGKAPPAAPRARRAPTAAKTRKRG